ncbi:MAG: argininosuccinate lyase [Methanomicrobiales archaeon]
MQEDVVRRGRLSGERTQEIQQFLSSMDADRSIAGADLLVDIAHLLMLKRQNVIDHDNAVAIMRVLLGMQGAGVPEVAFSDHFEDIHAGIESALIAAAGEEAGGRLHIGRSRNDEVATCIRLHLRDEIVEQLHSLVKLRFVLLACAEQHRESYMPGFTHFQHAQPTTLAHHLLAYEQAFSRDFDRLSEAYARVNRSPLGAAAFASTGYRIDRDYTATLLGFDGIIMNTMDAVATRDFALEVLSALSIMMATVSRLCEELVLWSSSFTGFVCLSDPFCSTSSIMPQKKNPDTAEIMRAKAGSVAGAYTAALVITKGLPMSYNRDLQELTPHLWRGTRDATMSLHLLPDMLSGARFDTDRMKSEAGRGMATATDVADLLVREHNLPFRTAHSIVGRAVKNGTLDKKTLDDAAREITETTLSERGLTEEQVITALSVEGSVASRDHPGGPAPSATAEAIALAREKLNMDRSSTESKKNLVSHSIETMLAEARRLVQ